MVYIPYTQGNMDIFQDIKVKPGEYGYFPGSGTSPLSTPAHPAKVRGALYPTK